MRGECHINEKGDLVKPNEATKIIIKEYTKDGNLIQETIGFTKKIFSTTIELGLNGTENTI